MGYTKHQGKPRNSAIFWCTRRWPLLYFYPFGSVKGGVILSTQVRECIIVHTYIAPLRTWSSISAHIEHGLRGLCVSCARCCLVCPHMFLYAHSLNHGLLDLTGWVKLTTHFRHRFIFCSEKGITCKQGWHRCIEHGHVATGCSAAEVYFMWLLNHLFFHTTAGETEHLPPDQLAAQHTPPRLHPNYQHQSGISPTCLTVYWSHKNWNQFSFFFFFCCTVSCQTYLTNCQTSPMKDAWSLKSVWSYTCPGTWGPSSDRDLREVNAFRRCWDINWEVFMRGQWGETLWNHQWVQERNACLATHFKVIIFWRRPERQLDLASKLGVWRGGRLSVVIAMP